MNHTRSLLASLALVAVSLCGVSSASANSIVLFNTGVDGSGAVLAHNTIGDLHYSLISVPSGSTATRIITSAGGFPIGPYLGDNTLSRWIGPNNDGDLNGPVGDYVYRTTFNLTGLIATSASISGRWSTDNKGVGIRLNGGTAVSAIGINTSFQSWHAFSLTGGFVAGVNTLDFIVNNEGGPTALRVEMSGTADAAPSQVPDGGATVALIGLVFAGLAVLRRRA